MGPPVLIQVWAFFFEAWSTLSTQILYPKHGHCKKRAILLKAPQKMGKSLGTTSFLHVFFPQNGLHLPFFSGCQRVGPSELKQLYTPFMDSGGWWEWCFLKIIIKIQAPQISFLLLGRRKAKRHRFEENLSWKIVENRQTWIIFAKDWG